MTFWTACASCLPFSCTPFDDDDQRRRRRRGAPDISAPRALRPRQSPRNTRTSWIASIIGNPSSSEQQPDHDPSENISTGVPLTTLSTEDVHLLERYQSLARAEGWTRPTSRSTASLPRTPDLDLPDEERLKLRGVQSRDYISLRSGTPSVRDQTPPPLPKKMGRTMRSPLSAQNPWAARRSIRHVGTFGEEEEDGGKGLFTPLPLELDFSPLDVFGGLMIDVQSDGTAERLVQGKVDLPSRPKLVHFATTPSRTRHDLDVPFDPDGGDQREKRSVSRRSVTPMHRPPPSTPRPRTITPIRNAPRSSASPHTSPRKSTSSWTQGIRSSIYRDLTPVEPSPACRRTRPDPALFPSVIPWKMSPRDSGMRRQEKEWRRLQAGDGQQEKWSTGSRSRWSWNGRPRSREMDVWKGRLAGSEDEAEREEDGWEVLR